MLNVGGRRFMTTAATLSAIEGSFLWKLVSVQQAAGHQKSGAEFFIDRNGSVSVVRPEVTLSRLRRERELSAKAAAWSRQSAAALELCVQYCHFWGTCTCKPDDRLCCGLCSCSSLCWSTFARCALRGSRGCRCRRTPSASSSYSERCVASQAKGRLAAASLSRLATCLPLLMTMWSSRACSHPEEAALFAYLCYIALCMLRNGPQAEFFGLPCLAEATREHLARDVKATQGGRSPSPVPDSASTSQPSRPGSGQFVSGDNSSGIRGPPGGSEGPGHEGLEVRHTCSVHCT